MVMQKIPKIRFKDENGEEYPEWEEKRLSEIVERITRRNSILTSNLVLTISAQQGLIEQNKFFNKIVASKNLSNYYLLHRGEFAYNKSYSSGYPWGAVKRLDKYNKGVLSSLYICFFPLKTISSDFLVQYYKTTFWHNGIAEVAVEGARNHGLLNISIGDFFSTKHIIPSLPEQEKIASFLSTFDKKIDKQAEKVKMLEDYKKGLMQMIFSQESRFQDENGEDYPEWGENRLGEIAKFNGGGTPSKKKKEYWKGNIPWVSSSDLCEDSIFNVTVGRHITSKAVQESATKLCPANTILIVSRVGVGKVALSYDPVCTSQDFTNITHIDGNPVFFAYLLSKLVKEEALKTQGTSIKGITIDVIKKIKLHFPALPEQKKIASFLSAFDQKIDKEREKLELLREFKKGLLQQIFV